MKALLKNYRQSPRKVRLVTRLIKGKTIPEARAILAYTTKAATVPLRKLLQSAVANAKYHFKCTEEDLIITDVVVGAGRTVKRHQPRARGAVYTLRKRASHITVLLAKRREGTSNPS